MVPLLDQGGLERICAMTAKLLTPHCHLTLVVFSTKGMIYDVDGVDMIDLNLGSVPGKVGKTVNLCKRIRAIKKNKKKTEHRNHIQLRTHRQSGECPYGSKG